MRTIGLYDWYAKQFSHMNWEKVKDAINGRNVYIWGAYREGYYFRRFLSKIGIDVFGYIDGKYDGALYDGIRCISGESIPPIKDSFIVIVVRGRKKGIDDVILNRGGVKGADYIYLYDSIPNYTLCDVSGIINDVFGNEIVVDGQVNCVIHVSGWDNKLRIHQHSGNNHLAIQMNGNAQINIGSNAIVDNGLVKIVSLFGGEVMVGDNVFLADGINIMSKGGGIKIGNNVEIGERSFFLCGQAAKLIVGDDCMFSQDVSLFASDGHSVLDMKNRKNLGAEKREVRLEDHVWIGRGATVLHNSIIESDCIVGANSLVKGRFTRGSIIAGNPASVVRTEVSWDRQEALEWSVFAARHNSV